MGVISQSNINVDTENTLESPMWEHSYIKVSIPKPPDHIVTYASTYKSVITEFNRWQHVETVYYTVCKRPFTALGAIRFANLKYVLSSPIQLAKITLPTRVGICEYSVARFLVVTELHNVLFKAPTESGPTPAWLS